MKLRHFSGKAVCASALVLLLSFEASAQTPMGGGVSATPPPPGATRAARADRNITLMEQSMGQPPAPSGQTGQVPMPASSVFQAADQAEGLYPTMSRVGAGGQIQETWNISAPRDGVYTARVCEDCVYKIRTREFMTTTLILPPDASIATADLGDPTGFQISMKAANMIAIRPVTYGIDTNLNVYTKSGKVYPFYVRAESFNSTNTPDVVVRLKGQEQESSGFGAIGLPTDLTPEDFNQGKYPGGKVASAIGDLTNPKPASGDFVRNVAFDPTKLHGWTDYRLWGGGDAVSELKPVMVYRDDFFTYLQYGEKFDPLELPSAYVVRDGIDELVNSRVVGNTFVVESVAPLISLKNGKSFLCIQYGGEKP